MSISAMIMHCDMFYVVHSAKFFKFPSPKRYEWVTCTPFRYSVLGCIYSSKTSEILLVVELGKNNVSGHPEL